MRYTKGVETLNRNCSFYNTSFPYVCILYLRKYKVYIKIKDEVITSYAQVRLFQYTNSIKNF